MASTYMRNDVLRSAAEHHSQYLAYAFGILGDWSAAEDVVQEAYLRIADKWEAYNRERPIFPWARSFVKNSCLEYRRRHSRESATGADALEFLIESKLNDFFYTVITKDRLSERVSSLQKCFESLNEKSKHLLYEFYVQGKNCKELADAEGVHYHTPINQLSRLRKKIRKCMQSHSSFQIESCENEESVLEDLFSRNDSESAREKIQSLISDCEDTVELFFQYVEEYTVFAIALKAWKDSSETAIIDAETAAAVSVSDVFSFNGRVGWPMAFLDTLDTQRENHRFQRSLIGWASGIAALLCISFSIWFLVASHAHSPIAKIDSVHGLVFMIRGGEKMDLVPGTSIRIDDRIATTKGAHCEIIYTDDLTTVKLEQDCVLTVTGDRQSKQLYLDRGKILCKVARQRKGKQMRLKTPHAEIAVLGTRFELEATPSSTVLHLYDGRLMFRDIVHDREILLKRGQYVSLQDGNFLSGEIENFSNRAYLLTQDMEFPNVGLIGLFRFDEGQGEVIKDLSSSKSSGHIEASLNMEDAWIPGPSGYSFRFPKRDRHGMDYSRSFRIRKFPAERVRDQLSVMMWIRLDPNKFNKTIENTLISSTGSDYGAGWRYRLSNKKGKLRTWFRVNYFRNQNTEKNRSNNLGSEAFEASLDWMHIGVVFDSGMVQFYYNGTPLGNSQQLADSFIRHSEFLSTFIGSFAQETFVSFDDVAIYNRALKAQEFLPYRN